MRFIALSPVQLVRQLAVGAERVLTRTLVTTATPVMRAVVGADSRAPAATHDASKPAAARTAQPTRDDRPLRIVDGASSGVVDPAEVRAWARGRGLQVGDRGRISAAITDQYLTHHAS